MGHKNFEIKIVSGEKALYLFGEFEASWNADVDDLKIIVPYAIAKAFQKGKEAKAKEIRKVIGLNEAGWDED